jgi:hypothetical protein
MLVKNITFEEVFSVLIQYQMKYNPSKYVFSIKGGKFLGFLVSSKRINPILKKIQAILNMTPPQTVNEVQCFTKRLNALNILIARLGEHTFPFFKTLRSMTTFEWTEDCQKAFEELKTHLLSPKILPQSRGNEDLFLYLRVADLAMSSVLVMEDAGVLHDAETR